MLYEWDETKRRKNIAMHDVDFSAVESFEWESAVIRQDTRKDYGETRYAALGPIEGGCIACVSPFATTSYALSA